jgi:hypothetical protein
MNKLKMAKIMALLAAGGLLAAGCEVRVHDPAGAAVVTTDPVYSDDYVTGPPPAPLEDTVVGVAPGPGYVWVGGSWGWHGNRWAWDHGRWDRPPHAGAHWEGGRYEYHNGRHVYHRGGWR